MHFWLSVQDAGRVALAWRTSATAQRLLGHPWQECLWEELRIGRDALKGSFSTADLPVAHELVFGPSEAHVVFIFEVVLINSRSEARPALPKTRCFPASSTSLAFGFWAFRGPSVMRSIWVLPFLNKGLVFTVVVLVLEYGLPPASQKL